MDYYQCVVQLAFMNQHFYTIPDRAESVRIRRHKNILKAPTQVNYFLLTTERERKKKTLL